MTISPGPGTLLSDRYLLVGEADRQGDDGVWRAIDRQAGNKEVAVRILPETLTAFPERLTRFKREAQILASLSHPNIIVTYATGDHGELQYAVTELLRGVNLRDYLAGALSMVDTLRIAREISRGIAGAHDHNVVHRNLTPESVFLFGLCVKILDFGLARAEWSRPTPGWQTPAPSGSHNEAIAYLSPEQVRGGEVGPPSDVFAFGSILYEMATGRRAFRGDTAADTMRAICEDRPAERVPPAIEEIVACCLEKDPNERYPSSRDLHVAVTRAA